jgi:integrase
MAGMIENKQRNALVAVFSNCSEDNKMLVDAIFFDEMNAAFFRVVPPETFISTLHYWLDSSAVLNHSFFEDIHFKAPQIPFTQLCSLWRKAFSNVAAQQHIYATAKIKVSVETSSTLLRHLFITPHTELSRKANEVSCLIRLLSFFAIRHYFINIQKKQRTFKAIELRIKGLTKFIQTVEIYLAKGQVNDTLHTLYDVIDFSAPHFKLDIDKGFFSQNLFKAFEENLDLAIKSEPKLIAPVIEQPNNDDESQLANSNDINTSPSRDEAERLPIKSQRLLSGIKALSVSEVDTANDEVDETETKLQLKCVASSLISRETLKPSFRNFKRKPEYPLQLPGLNYALKSREKRILVAQLLEDLSGDDFSRETLTVLLAILTASSLQRLTSFVVTTTFNDEYINSICLKSGVWRRHSLAFEKSFNPDQEQLSWLAPHDDFLQLHLPWGIIVALKRQAAKLNISAEIISEGVPLYVLLGLDRPDLSDSINAYMNKLKLSFNYGSRQLTQKAMRYTLYAEIAQSVDASSASLLFATSEFSNPITLYYLSLSEKKLQEHYDEALRKLGFDTASVALCREVFIGSRMPVNVDKFTARVKSKVDKLETLLDTPNENIEQVIQRHNDFACIVSLAFALSGALREQAGYFFDYATVNESGGYFIVCDKYHIGENPTRLLPLPPLVTSLLHEYRLQLRVTAHALKEDYPQLATLLFSLYQPSRSGPYDQPHSQTGLPLLGLIVDGRWQNISSASINAFLGDDFALPGNFTRHLTCSHMPQPLIKYRQQLMGHNNQGHHVLDEMSMSLSWFDDERVLNAMDNMLQSLGFVSLKAQSLRGAFSLERLPNKSVFYPQGFIERQKHSARAYLFARKHFKAMLKQLDPSENIEQAVANLLRKLEAFKSEEQLSHLVDQFYSSWQNTYKKSGEASVLAEINGLKKSENEISLQLVEFSRYVEQLQHHFLTCLANGTMALSSKGAFFISLVLYQPRIAMQISKLGQSAVVSVTQYQSTLLLQAGSKDTDRVSCPINFLSSFLLMQLNATEQFRINFNDTTKILKGWLEGAVKTIGPGLPAISSIEGLCRFVSEYGLSTQSRLSVSASKDTVLAGDYSPQDIARLLKHSSGNFFENKNFSAPPQSKPVNRRRLLNALNLDGKSLPFLMQKEEEFVKKVLKALNEKNDSSKDNSGAKIILKLWAEYVGAKTKTLKHLLNASNICSEFLILWLFYGVKASGRPSPIKINNKIASFSVYKYLRIVAGHLQNRVQDDAFLLNDEESLEELYFYAISESHHDKKHEVYRCIKDFHNEINREFTIDAPDWRMLEQFADSTKKKRVGIARLFAFADYERAKRFFLESQVGDPNGALTQIEVDMHIVILALAYRLGFRKREIRNLQIRHINISDKLITVTGTRNYATKSINSPRRIEMSLFLDEDERGSLLRVIQNAKKMGGGVASPALFGSGTLENRLMKIDTIVRNVMDVCRTTSGNHKLRFYDLRHTFINYVLMILARFHEDKRYTTSLSHWARCEPNSLTDFRVELMTYLIGGQSEVGGISIYGLARRLGHSPITARQYYIHILNLLDDVVVNRLLGRQVPQSPFFEMLKQALHDDKGGFRAEQSVRKSIKTLNYPSLVKQAKIPFQEFQEPFRVLSQQYQFESFIMRIYRCLVECWKCREDEVAQRHVLKEAALPKVVWEMLYEQMTETGYRGIYLPTCLGLSTDYVPDQVDIALRYMNATHFRTMVDVVTSLYQNASTALTELMPFYTSHMHGDVVILLEEEIATFKKLLNPFDDLALIFNPTASPHRRRGRNNAYYQLELVSKNAKRKTTNDKFNFLVMLSSAVLAGMSFQP